ncbi:hypothetical protein BEL07_19750 [Mycolicibacterium grossiae]|uniref:Uncharacterized protein n=1 Tax=Mycolicibacterium grossiae TaxID=1552759 RepID=A0A1E8Q0Q1_9MYCO|nr:hypothetical protein BEL07_19750 [Mycolicibacterium grossiae]
MTAVLSANVVGADPVAAMSVAVDLVAAWAAGSSALFTAVGETDCGAAVSTCSGVAVAWGGPSEPWVAGCGEVTSVDATGASTGSAGVSVAGSTGVSVTGSTGAASADAGSTASAGSADVPDVPPVVGPALAAPSVAAPAAPVP